MITFTEFAATQKRINGNCLLRVTQIANGQAVPGMRVRAIDQDNALLTGVGHRDTKGGVGWLADRRARKMATARSAKPGARMVLPRNRREWTGIATGVCGQRFGESSGFRGLRRQTEKAASSIAFWPLPPTARSIVQGQTLKMKGFVREVEADGTLRVPHDREAGWKITGSDEQVAAGTTKAWMAYGGFEAEWAKGRRLRCRLAPFK